MRRHSIPAYLLLALCALGYSSGWIFAASPFGKTAGTQLWKFDPEVPGAWSGASIGPDGTIYVTLCAATDMGVVYALDGATGAKRWQYTSSCLTSTLAIGTDGTVYVAGGDHRVYAFSGLDGTIRWSFPAASQFEASPAIGADGTVYVGCNDNRLYALNGATGDKSWEYATGGAIHEAPAIGLDGTVYTGSSDGNLYALAGATGAKRWAFTTGVRSSAPRLSVGTAQSISVRATTSSMRWTGPTGPSVGSTKPRAGLVSGSGARNGCHRLQRWDHALLEADTGEVCWFLPFVDPITRSHPAIGTDRNLYLARSIG